MGKRPFRLTAPVIREGPTHTQIAGVFRLEIAAPGVVSRFGVVWWSVDIANYEGNAPGIRTSHGVIAGIPDIQVVYVGLSSFIEVKPFDGDVSRPQRGLSTSLVIAGARWGVARTCDEAVALLDYWQIPRNHRVRVAA